MQQLNKIDEQTNVLTWFEIPVSDIDRAKTFYEAILDIEMVKRADGNDEAVFFPFDPNVVQATSGRVTGVLSRTERNSPSSHGTVVYINASPGIQTVLDKVEHAGGKIIAPKMQIPAGFIAIIIDTEGNKVGLHVYIGDSGPSVSLEDGPVVSVILGQQLYDYFFTFLKDSPDKLTRCAP